MSAFDEKGNLIISTFDENLVIYQNEYEKKFGLVDIAPASVEGALVAITAEMKKRADEFTQNAFSQNSPYEAIGEGLDNLCFLRGIIRKINEHSVVLLSFTGENNIEIPKGTEIKNTLTDSIFITNEKGTIEDGFYQVFATALNSGRVVCKANSPLEFVSALDGVSVTNQNDAILGYDKESDTQLRTRLFNYNNSLSVDDDLYIKLSNLHNVKYVNIESNSELVIDSNGIDPKSTSIIVIGGENKDIAQAIYSTIPADKKTFGDILEFISSSVSSKEYPIYFSRPKLQRIILSIHIVKDSFFDMNSQNNIKESILAYFEDKFKISNDVLIDSLYIPAQEDYKTGLSFRGIKNVNILLNGATENINISYDEWATLSLEDIELTITAEE